MIKLGKPILPSVNQIFSAVYELGVFPSQQTAGYMNPIHKKRMQKRTSESALTSKF